MTDISDTIRDCQMRLILWDMIIDMITDKISGTDQGAHYLPNAKANTISVLSGEKSFVYELASTVKGGEHIVPRIESQKLSWWAEAHLRQQRRKLTLTSHNVYWLVATCYSLCLQPFCLLIFPASFCLFAKNIPASDMVCCMAPSNSPLLYL